MKKKILKTTNKEWFAIVAVILIAVLSVYKLLLPGFYEPQDLHHVADIFEMYRAISSGQLPPRWGPDFLYGYGYPLFNFYYVGPFYLGSLLYFLSGSLQFSYEAIFEIAAVAGAIGFYLFLRKHFSKIASLAASALFIFTPYRAVQIFVRGAMGEFLSVSLFPWLLYFLEKYEDDRKKRWLILSGVSGLFIFLSHNFFWVLIFGFSFLYFLIRLIYEKKYFAIKIFAAVVLFSIGASSYWWIPAIFEQNLLLTQTPFPLVDHFPFIKQLIIPSWGYGASVWGPYDGMSFQLGIVNILVFLVSMAMVIFLKFKKTSSIYIWSIISFILCLIFMNSRSLSIWQLVPFYNLFQFPWRLLAFTGFFSSVLAAFLVDRFFEAKKIILGRTTAIIILVLSVVLTIGYFRPSKIFYKSDRDYLTRFFAAPVLFPGSVITQDYKNYSEDYLLLPKWMENKPNALPQEKIQSSNPEIYISGIEKLSSVSWEANVSSDVSGKIDFYSLYFPGWIGKVDGKEVLLERGDLGQIELNINPGEHKINLFWEETKFRKVADWISVLCIVLGVILVGVSKKPYATKIHKQN